MFNKDNSFGVLITIVLCTVLISGSVVFLGLQISKGGPTAEPKRNDSLESYFKTATADMTSLDDPVLGKPDAPVTILEFSDYQCPFCRSYYLNAYKEIKTNYVDKGLVKVIFKDYPLPFHDDSIYTSNAANCVQEQSGDVAYFKFHDAVFDMQGAFENGTVQITDDQIVDLADEMDLDMRTFKKCVSDKKYYGEIAEDLLAGEKMWAETGIADSFGTPTLFVNGKPVVGAQPFEVFKELIDAELAKIKK